MILSDKIKFSYLYCVYMCAYIKEKEIFQCVKSKASILFLNVTN